MHSTRSASLAIAHTAHSLAVSASLSRGELKTKIYSHAHSLILSHRVGCVFHSVSLTLLLSGSLTGSLSLQCLFLSVCLSLGVSHLVLQVFIYDVPQLDVEQDCDEIRRFINLIDAFYEAHVKVLVLADAAPKVAVSLFLHSTLSLALTAAL